MDFIDYFEYIKNRFLKILNDLGTKSRSMAPLVPIDSDLIAMLMKMIVEMVFIQLCNRYL